MKRLLAVLLALLLSQPALAQDRYTQAELDQLLAPIALYPDALLSQVLMAATYPLEVVEAARFSRAHPGLQGDEAVRSAQEKDWDPSVKSLLAFPHLLQRMDETLDWTKQLGDAFLAQEGDVMDTVQHLRRQAQAAGHLLADERVRVVDDGTVVVVEYANPSYVYVPYYDPWVVYGTWGWPAYPPVIWAPWPGYVAVRPGIWWGTRIGISVGFFFGSVSWPQRHVTVVNVANYYVRPPVVRRDVIVRHPIKIGRWRHDATHRRGVVYRHPQVQQRFGDAPRAPARRIERSAPRRVAPQPQPRREERREERRDDRRGNLMPPAWRTSSSQSAAPAPRAVPYDRAHGRPARTVDRADRVGRVRADAAQYRPAQPDRVAGHARRDAGAVPVRPAVRAGVAGDRPRMAR